MLKILVYFHLLAKNINILQLNIILCSWYISLLLRWKEKVQTWSISANVSSVCWEQRWVKYTVVMVRQYVAAIQGHLPVFAFHWEDVGVLSVLTYSHAAGGAFTYLSLHYLQDYVTNNMRGILKCEEERNVLQREESSNSFTLSESVRYCMYET